MPHSYLLYINIQQLNLYSTELLSVLYANFTLAHAIIMCFITGIKTHISKHLSRS